MKKRLKPAARRIIIIAAGVIVSLCAIGGYIAFDEYTYRFKSIVEKSGTVKIYPDDDFESVANKLEKDGFIKSRSKLERMAIKHDKDSVQVGSYALTRGESYRTLLTRINSGRQTPIKLTFNNIRTIEQLAGRVARYTLVDSLDLLKHFKKEAHQSDHAQSYIARFMPNTYEVYWTVGPAEFSEMMLSNYNDFWDSKARRSKAEKLGFTPREVMILASIVIEETKAEKEMSTVAGVYINRLAKGMPLQADPTVKFAIGNFAIRRVLSKHLRYESPYNTYINKGLPPGPICSPAIVAIDAVLDYADNEHNYLYFCANSDFSGTHAFATTLTQHNANARAYHRALNQRSIR